MSTKREMMPEESKRLVEIYRSQSKLTLLEVIDKYSSPEYKAMLEDIEKEEWEEL